MPAKKKIGSGGAAWLRRTRGSKRPKASTLKYLPGKVFVAMTFSDAPEKSRVFQAIVRACKKFNLTAARVDELVGSGNILLRVIEGIEDGEFLIFDLTKEKPNVYYELGYAHGVGNRPEDIILIAKKGTKIHFDITAFRLLFYESSANLEKVLAAELKKLVPLSRGTDGH